MANEKVFAHSFVYMFGRLVEKGQTILLMFLAVHFMLPSEVGQLTPLTLLSTFIQTTVTATVSGAILRYYVDYTDPLVRKQFTGSIIIFLVLCAALVVLIMTLGGRFIVDVLFPNTHLSFYPYYFFPAVAIVFTMPYNVVYALYRIKEKPFQLLAIQFVILAVASTITFVAIGILKRGLIGFVWAQLSIGILLGSFYWIVLKRDSIYKFKWELLKPALLFSAPLIPFLLVSFLQGSVDRFVLEKYVSLADLGKYSVALLFSNSLTVVISGLASAYSPRMYHIIKEFGEESARGQIKQMMKWVFLISFSVFFCLSIFSEDLVRIFANQDYLSAYKIIPVLALSVFVRGIYLLFQNVLYWTKKTSHVFYVNLYSFVGTTLCTLLLVPFWGLMGAALANLFGQVVSVVAGYYHAQHFFRVDWNFRRQSIYWFLSLLVIGAFVYGWHAQSLFASFGIHVIGCLLYCIVLMLCRVVGKEHVVRVLQHVPVRFRKIK